MRPGHQCSLPEFSRASLWGEGILLLLFSSLGHLRAEIPRRMSPTLDLDSCCSSDPSPQLLPRLWVLPGLGRANTSVGFQDRVFIMRRPLAPVSQLTGLQWKHCAVSCHGNRYLRRNCLVMSGQ